MLPETQEQRIDIELNRHLQHGCHGHCGKFKDPRQQALHIARKLQPVVEVQLLSCRCCLGGNWVGIVFWTKHGDINR